MCASFCAKIPRVKLYEFEGHNLFSKVGIESPFFVVCSNMEEVEQARQRMKFPIVAKVQVLSGKRGRGGGIKIVTTDKLLKDFCREMFGSIFPPSHEASAGAKALADKSEGRGGGEEVRFISLAEKVEIKSELYASIAYDTTLKIPFLLFSQEGGMDIEEIKAKEPEKILRVNINPFSGPNKKDLIKIVDNDEQLIDFLVRLWDAFVRFDCRLLEVNPIARVGDEYVAVDAKVILDDAALSRHRDLDVLPKGAAGAVPTAREIEARKIDGEDYRGSAGSTFIEFGSDPDEKYGAGIAVLASGGGASLLVMDALVAAGGKPSNYTEYSGNPPREKVEKLTEITLSREGLSGCLVCGAVANFTDIYATLAGFCDGLRKISPKPEFPIVIRRGGPKQKEAYEMLTRFAKKESFDIHLFGPETPISVACKAMVELSEAYRSKLKS
ncbi:MAG: Succinyl-CoA synthetase, beta subunit [Candidatus Curtissbacteria bacterium GW2011_GWA1_40_9]|uniref:Succinyl-CoA synthetase, beta subunit n=1 Tax=Candidatus Curtissbacteria bacterium GW2011_GWA1_40_9 TaxID=1618408 RepID=A0A0G0TTW0_9BACT|nr:MAG: Succinyl-CoA synthetase, beta subunit [Candidatus Curtissbacteria bacterium GW2011_GWA1_40_9]